MNSEEPIKIYDFDEYSLFFLNLIVNLPDYTLIRWSAGGFGIHVETDHDLSKFQDQNRQFWSEQYGYNITWLTKNKNKVSDWYEMQTFLNSNFSILINRCINRKKKNRNIYNANKK